jgi:hypothetical protein
MDTAELQRIWHEHSDAEIAEALRTIDDFDEEARKNIRAEARQRPGIDALIAKGHAETAKTIVKSPAMSKIQSGMLLLAIGIGLNVLFRSLPGNSHAATPETVTGLDVARAFAIMLLTLASVVIGLFGAFRIIVGLIGGLVGAGRRRRGSD